MAEETENHAHHDVHAETAQDEEREDMSHGVETAVHGVEMDEDRGNEARQELSRSCRMGR